MPLFFKIAEDGRSIYVTRTIFANKIKDGEFEEKSKKISIEKFLSKMPKSMVGKIEENIKKVQKIYDLKLSVLGSYSISNPVTRTSAYIYFVGDKRFVQEYGEEAKRNEEFDAISYGYKFYGKEFMEKNKDKLNKGGTHYFTGDKEISQKEYDSLKEQFDKLTTIVKLNQIEKDVNYKK